MLKKCSQHKFFYGIFSGGIKAKFVTKKKLAILTCMDTRLTWLLPAALGLQNGDAKIIRNAGGVISNPYGSEVRSLLVAIIELGVTTVMIIGHTDCGVEKMEVMDTGTGELVSV